MINERAEPNLHSWERQILLAVVSVLFLILAAYARAALIKIDEISQNLAKDRLELAEYRILMERRLTIVEQRQEAMIFNFAKERFYDPNHTERSPDRDAER